MRFCRCILLLIPVLTQAQNVAEPTQHPSDWTQPYAPFRIAGNLYYVGTVDLACYLVTTPKGNILINTGLASSSTTLKANIEKLGFHFAEIKILLTTQAHYDHMGAMASIKKITGAKFMVNEEDAPVAADGGKSDYAVGGPESSYQPIQADRLLHDRDSVSLGGSTLIMLHHPGHTKGSASYLVQVKDEHKTYTVLIANMPTIVTDKSFSNLPEYPGIENDYTTTIAAMKNLKFDLWLASHASQFNLHAKHRPGDTYYPEAFADQKGYDDEIEQLERALEKKKKE